MATTVPKLFNGERSLFNKSCWENWVSTCKRMKGDPYLTSYTKINSTWVKGLNKKSKSFKTLRRQHGATFHDTEMVCWI